MTKQDVKQMDTEKQGVMPVHKNVYVALAAAQSEMGPLVKGSNNPHFKSKYADLADLVTAVRGPFNRNGLAFFHQIVRGDGWSDMRTIVMHGETETSIQCDVALIVAKNDMQGMKSATTYAKRIGLESVSGVAPEDDDGNAAAKAAPKSEPKSAPQTVTPDQFVKLRDRAVEVGVDEAVICKAHNAQSFQQFPAAEFPEAMRRLQQTLDERAATAQNADLDGDRIPEDV